MDNYEKIEDFIVCIENNLLRLLFKYVMIKFLMLELIL